MWHRMQAWYRGWEDDIRAALERPELVEQMPAGYRRRTVEPIRKLSTIERRQLRDFAEACRGLRGLFALGLLAMCFTLAGIVLHVLFGQTHWIVPILLANMAGFGMFIGIAGVWFNYRRVARAKWKLVAKAMAGTVVAGCLAAAGILLYTGTRIGQVWDIVPGFVAVVLAAGLLAALPMIAVSVLRNRQYEVLTAQLQAEAERERLARELSEARLRMLRAQIEPHFLFNTLGAVQQLAQHGAPRAAELTANLIAFLRGSLGDMRSDEVGLRAEFSLVESYLNVMQVRLGARLRFRIDLPPALDAVRVPSMIVLTLVENAVKHGIEPALRGGEIVVSAQQEEGIVRLRVADSGVGMDPAPDDETGGMGLDNVRHRLRLAYGDAASMALHDADPGLVADIVIPVAAGGR
jgi:sensor histidine kinase YesM